MSADPQGGKRPDNIAAAIADVSERASLLIREEIELAKAEVTEKVTKLVKGAVVGVAAGIFFLFALFFVLIGCAWLLYYFLPVNEFAYFFGFFAMAVILIVLGVIAGLIAAKVVKRGSPPVPSMAIEEAQKIKQAVSTPPAGRAPAYSPPPAAAEPVPPPSSPTPPFAAPEPVLPEPPAPEPVSPEPPAPESAVPDPPAPEPPAAAYESSAPEALAQPPAAEESAAAAEPVPEPPAPEASEPITDEHRAAPPPPPPGEGGLAADAIFSKPRNEGEE